MNTFDFNSIEGKTDSSEKITEGAVICPKCKNCFKQQSKSTTMGFRKYICPECNTKFIYPLRARTSFIYWFAAIVIMPFLFIGYLYQYGQIPIPGLLGIAVIYAIVRNITLKQEISDREFGQKDQSEQYGKEEDKK